MGEGVQEHHEPHNNTTSGPVPLRRHRSVRHQSQGSLQLDSYAMLLVYCDSTVPRQDKTSHCVGKARRSEVIEPLVHRDRPPL